MDMKVELERQCTATRRWFPVAKFELGLDAMDCAEALSIKDGCRYRVVDPRWPDQAPLTTIYANGTEEG